MQLQRSNKYTKKITKGITSILLTSSILLNGTSVVASSVNNNTKIEIASDEKDQYYYLNFYKISDKDKNDRLSKLDIKYPNALHRMDYINTLVVDDNGVYKIIPVIELYDLFEEKTDIYDLFTEEKLFELKETKDYYYNNIKSDDYGMIHGHDFTKIENEIPYFKEHQVVEYGLSYYSAVFFEKHLYEFIKKDGINYKIDVDSIISYLYNIPFYTYKTLFTTYKLADNYVTTVPNENRVTSEELGVKSTYRIEDKYSDFWKISDEEINEKILNFEISNSTETYNELTVHTLVLKDKDDNYKLLNVLLKDENNDGNIEFIDLYTEKYLFEAPFEGEFYYFVGENDYEHENKGINFEKMRNAIPYFDDKTIVKLDIANATNAFMYENFNYFRKKDKINYKYIEGSYYSRIYPLENNSDEPIVLSKEAYLKNYVVTLPEDLQVPTKELLKGLDNVKTKTLN